MGGFEGKCDVEGRKEQERSFGVTSGRGELSVVVVYWLWWTGIAFENLRVVGRRETQVVCVHQELIVGEEARGGIMAYLYAEESNPWPIASRREVEGNKQVKMVGML